jgi:hypothetical protein
MNLITNYANFSQLVVVDGTDGSILYAKEVSRKNDGKDEVFRVPPLKADRPQLFLLLMGHKDDVEDKDESPTLLAAGFSSRPANDERKVLLYMWPINVETEFSSDLPEVPGKEPVTYNPVTGVFELWPADSEMKWTLTTEGGGDPLAPLIAAQEAIKGNAPSTPAEGKWDKVYPSQRLIVRDPVIKTSGDWEDTLSLEGGVGRDISWDMSEYTEGPANQLNEGSVNFNLGYVPFNLTDPAAWQKWRKEITPGGITLSGGLPVWIIRNGINDAAQGGATANFKVKQRYWAAKGDDNGKVVPVVPGDDGYKTWNGPTAKIGGWGMDNSTFQYGGQSKFGVLIACKLVWDEYKGRLLTGEEASGIVEFEIDQDKSEGDVSCFYFSWDDNKLQQRLVKREDLPTHWGAVFVKGTLRKGIKDTAKDWTSASSFTLNW